MEERFRREMGDEMSERVAAYVRQHGLAESYAQSATDPSALFDFSFHYGILPFVAFCYCALRCPVDIHGLAGPRDDEGEQPEDPTAVRVAVESAAPMSKHCFRQWDKYAARRSECLRYMLRMIKYSRYTLKNGRFTYQIVPKYVETHRLLDVSF